MKAKKLLPLMISCLLLSGCWDRVEIDRRLIISSIGVDTGKDIDQTKDIKKLKPEDPFQEREQLQKLSITYGYPDLSEMGPGKSGTAKDEYITTDASSMEDAVEKAAGKSSRDIFLGHTRLIILSSTLLEHADAFKEVLDYLERDPTLNKMMYVVVAEGKAEDFTKVKPPMEKNVEAYLNGLMENSKRNSGILPVTLSELITLLEENGSAIIPRISMNKEKSGGSGNNGEITLSGVGVIKDYTLKGYMTPVEVSNLELLRGKLRGGKKVIYLDGHPIDFSIEDMERKIRMSYDNNKLRFTIYIRLEGQVKEYYVGEVISSKDRLNQIQQYFNSSISQECEVIAKMIQTRFQVDPIGLREYVEKYNPAVWNKIKNNWYEAYNNAEIKVNTDTKIRRIGVTK